MEGNFLRGSRRVPSAGCLVAQKFPRGSHGRGRSFSSGGFGGRGDRRPFWGAHLGARPRGQRSPGKWSTGGVLLFPLPALSGERPAWLPLGSAFYYGFQKTSPGKPPLSRRHGSGGLGGHFRGVGFLLGRCFSGERLRTGALRRAFHSGRGRSFSSGRVPGKSARSPAGTSQGPEISREMLPRRRPVFPVSRPTPGNGPPGSLGVCVLL